METSIIVQNLKCGGCAKTIVSKLSDLENVSKVAVDVDTATVTFSHQVVTDVTKVSEKLKTLGYPAITDKNSMAAKAISFVSCATGKMSKP